MSRVQVWQLGGAAAKKVGPPQMAAGCAGCFASYCRAVIMRTTSFLSRWRVELVCMCVKSC